MAKQAKNSKKLAAKTMAKKSVKKPVKKTTAKRTTKSTKEVYYPTLVSFLVSTAAVMVLVTLALFVTM